ncbi:protein kinase [Nocardia sp. NPDC049526]|uniref:serine/threonine-protein kinase n=1 Tax=Nocardia sp. NPDC049526 TaxID=3364316 RepID=UPI0037BCD8B0
MGKTWFGHYRLDRLLGTGGTGQVWLARDTVADRAVALKVLACSHAADPTCRLRFTREARLAAQAPGPHRVPIHTFGELDGRLYIDMEFIEGTDVSALLRDTGPLDPARAVAIIAQTAMALDAMHRVGLVHRDVKPSNIMVGPTGFVHLIDFGIAHRIDQPAITAHGNVVGTLAYMAPERFDGIADARADQYSLACVLYECLTGQRPFGNVDSPQQLRAHLLTAPPSAATQNPAVPATLDAVITRAMAKDPRQRYSSAGEFACAAYVAVTGREASTVEIAASTVPTGVPEPWRAAESVGVGAGPCVAGSAGEPMRAGGVEQMQVAESAAASMLALGAAGEQVRDAGSACAAMQGGPSEGAEIRAARPADELMRGGSSEGERVRPVQPVPETMWAGGVEVAGMGDAGAVPESAWGGAVVGAGMRGGSSEGARVRPVQPVPETMWAGGVEVAGMGDAGAVPEPTRGAGAAGGSMRAGAATGQGMRDVGGVRDSMRGGRSEGQPVLGGAAVAERTRDVGTSGESTWVGGGAWESGRDVELRGEGESWWGVGPGHAAVAIAALVAVIGLALWLGRPGGETSSAAPSAARTTPAVPGSLVPTESAQAASPNVLIPGLGQLCNPDVDGDTVAADGTPLVCRTVDGGIANWVPAQTLGEMPDDPTVVGNGNPHVNSSANGNDKPNKGKPGHGGGRAKPGK